MNQCPDCIEPAEPADPVDGPALGLLQDASGRWWHTGCAEAALAAIPGAWEE